MVGTLTWFSGRVTCLRYLARVVGLPGDYLMTPTVANGQPAAAAYQRGDDGRYQAFGLGVLTVTGGGIAKITVFGGGPRLVESFGLPATTNRWTVLLGMLPRMPQQPTEISIVSGYFNPLHVGHLDMMEAARSLTGYLVVIVNNDAQQALKKGKVIQSLDHRLRIVRALRVTDDAIAAVDEDATVRESLRLVRGRYPEAALTFANGGDRSQRLGGRGVRGVRGPRHRAALRRRRRDEGGLEFSHQRRPGPGADSLRSRGEDRVLYPEPGTFVIECGGGPVGRLRPDGAD